MPASANVQIAPMFLKNLHPAPWQHLLLVMTWGHAAQLAGLKECASTSILCLRFHLEGEAGLKHDRRQQRQKEEL